MDQEKQQAFVQMVRSRGGDTGEVAVTVDEFFDGNDDTESIAVHAVHKPSLSTIRRVLDGLRAHPAVHDVYLEVEQLKFPRYPDGSWPYANSVGVVAKLEGRQLDELAVEAAPDPASEVDGDTVFPGHEVPPGYRHFEMGWD